MKTKTVLITALAMALTFGAPVAAESSAEGQLVVTGEGRVVVAPDLAVITLGVGKEAAEASEAMGLVSEDMAAVVTELRSAGIAEKDMQTEQISLHPVWSNSGSYDDDNPRRITGFAASNTLTLRVRDLEELGAVMDRVLRAGANQFQGLRFDVTDHASLQDQMRASAVADARHKAEILAQAAGVTLGPVRMITDTAQNDGHPMVAMEMARGGSMPIESGELSFSHSVQVIFGLQASEGE
ncbi:SIMPL domain-containing protein [Pseudophaeobacter sp.]|uniref:SIMPL domain-containing protein n=1 Tax=Pseudophaeobacter sp. TaxID=1971739 RepID=UPI003299BB84